MCGIYGFKAREGERLTPFESTVLSTVLAKEMEYRGRDSWGGVIFPNNKAVKKEARIFKGVGPVTRKASNFFKVAAYAQTLLGHTRAATVGKVSVENSHPFLIGNVLGVHNGGIGNYADLNKKYSREFEVDSQQIFAHINEGLDLEEIEGYGAFVYSRKDEEWDKIYLARTNGGNLTVARLFRGDPDKEHKNFFALAWSSEKAAIEKAADLLGVQYTEVGIDPAKLYIIEPDGEIYDYKKPFVLTSYARVYSSKAGDSSWTNQCLDPVAGNIDYLVYRSWCLHCKCELSNHKYGTCKDSASTKCGTKKANESCLKSEKLTYCKDCGHFLIKDIHSVVDGKVHCGTCDKDCRVSPIWSSSKDKKADIPPFMDDDNNEVIDLTEHDDATAMNRMFGKKAKKKLIKKAQKLIRSSSESSLVSPSPKNLVPRDAVARAFKTTDHGTVSTPICKECFCDLVSHEWGWCTSIGNCKAPMTAPCDLADLPLCTDCGCFMVEGVHVDSHMQGRENIVWCTVHKDYCTSAAEESESEKKEEIATLVVENDGME